MAGSGTTTPDEFGRYGDPRQMLESPGAPTHHALLALHPRCHGPWLMWWRGSLVAWVGDGWVARVGRHAFAAGDPERARRTGLWPAGRSLAEQPAGAAGRRAAAGVAAGRPSQHERPDRGGPRHLPRRAPGLQLTLASALQAGESGSMSPLRGARWARGGEMGCVLIRHPRRTAVRGSQALPGRSSGPESFGAVPIAQSKQLNASRRQRPRPTM